MNIKDPKIVFKLACKNKTDYLEKDEVGNLLRMFFDDDAVNIDSHFEEIWKFFDQEQPNVNLTKFSNILIFIQAI